MKAFHEKCGIFGVFNHRESAKITYLGLHALQHRGQESAGMVVSDGKILRTHKQMGLVVEIFDHNTLEMLKGDMAIGHVRYSTTGETTIRNAQPFTAEYSLGAIAVCHNGTLTNFDEIREKLENEGAIFASTSDTESFIHLIAKSKRGLVIDRILESLGEVEGAYSLLFLTKNLLVAARDPHGIRPLILGKLGKSFLLSSESTSFKLLGGKEIKDILPGEVVVFDRNSNPLLYKSIFPFDKKEKHLCIFEFIYFARPDSVIDGISVYHARKKLGIQLAREHYVDADVVVPVPDSGTISALGFSQESSIPFEMGLIRSHYIGRTFIEPSQSIRDFGVKLKLAAVKDVIKGKRVIVIDDSIVRGTTSHKIVRMLRQAGAKKIHLRISSPPTRFPCYYGIDTPTRTELIASFKEKSEIENFLMVDSIGYLSLEGCFKALGSYEGFCHACFSGQYPVPINKQISKYHQTKLIICDSNNKK